MRDLFDIFRIGPGGATWCEEAGDAATAMRRAAARANAELSDASSNAFSASNISAIS